MARVLSWNCRLTVATSWCWNRKPHVLAPRRHRLYKYIVRIVLFRRCPPSLRAVVAIAISTVFHRGHRALSGDSKAQARAGRACCGAEASSRIPGIFQGSFVKKAGRLPRAGILPPEPLAEPRPSCGGSGRGTGCSRSPSMATMARPQPSGFCSEHSGLGPWHQRRVVGHDFEFGNAAPETLRTLTEMWRGGRLQRYRLDTVTASDTKKFPPP